MFRIQIVRGIGVMALLCWAAGVMPKAVVAGNADESTAEEVTICHLPPGNPAEAATLAVGLRAVVAHLSHGDFIGPCEGGCVDNENCSVNEYCAKAVGDCGGDGVCQPRPEFCADIYAPVCGCDGVTYSNECFAAGWGVNVAFSGECL